MATNAAVSAPFAAFDEVSVPRGFEADAGLVAVDERFSFEDDVVFGRAPAEAPFDVFAIGFRVLAMLIRNCE